MRYINIEVYALYMFFDIFNIKPVNCTLKMPGIYANFELFLYFVCTHSVVCYGANMTLLITIPDSRCKPLPVADPGFPVGGRGPVRGGVDL